MLLHSCPKGGWSFERVLPALARSFTCYVADLPGFDRSEVPQRRYTLGDYTDAVVDVMRSAGLESADFAGTRMGAILSMCMAVYHPERVRRLVLEDCPGWTRAEGLERYETFFKPQYDARGLPQPTRYEEAVTLHPALSRDEHERANRNVAANPEWVHNCHQSHTTFDLAGLIPGIQAPTLVLFGEKNSARRHERRFVDGIPDVQLRIMPGVAEASYEFPTSSSPRLCRF